MFFNKIYDYIQNSAEYPEPGLGDEDNMRVDTSPCSSSRGYNAGAKKQIFKVKESILENE